MNISSALKGCCVATFLSGSTEQDARGGGPNASSGQDARGRDLSGYSLITARMH